MDDVFLQEDPDAPFYGVHSAKSGDLTGELTVQDILDRRPAGDILLARPSRRASTTREQGPSVKEIRHRLELERLAHTLEKEAALDHLLPRWWDADSGGVLLKPYRPGRVAKPDDTVGFLALDHYPNREPRPGEPGYIYDEPPIGHETDSHPLMDLSETRLDPIDTRVKQPSLWKQALLGLGLVKEKQ